MLRVDGSTRRRRSTGWRPRGCGSTVLHGVAGVLAVAGRAAHRVLPAADRLRRLRRAAGAVPRPARRPARRRRSASAGCCPAPATARRWSASGTAATSRPSSRPTTGSTHWFGLPYSNDMGRQAMPDATDAPWRASGALPADPLPLLLDDEVLEQQPDQASLTERYVAEAVRFLREPATTGRSSSTSPTSTSTCRSTCRSASPGGRATAPTGRRSRRIDWATGVILARARVARARRRHDRRVHERQRLAGASTAGATRPLRGAKATTWEGGHAGAVHRPLAGPHRAGPHERRARHGDGPVPDARRARAAPSCPPTARSTVATSPTLLLDRQAASPHEAFFYYWMDDLEAVRGRPLEAARRQARRRGRPSSTTSIADPGETTDVSPSAPGRRRRARAPTPSEARRVAG